MNAPTGVIQRAIQTLSVVWPTTTKDDVEVDVKLLQLRRSYSSHSCEDGADA